ncbi:hypothetical protein SAY86_002069 [Trapa natans]|uniref:Uncharacterized protein n=1 Tax=Trapa natans TaxID=22666 RepID=A0AAN7LQ13_TRANT|nr:hypothetical protein SAY86_002069 [Trapa natans]
MEDCDGFDSYECSFSEADVSAMVLTLSRIIGTESDGDLGAQQQATIVQAVSEDKPSTREVHYRPHPPQPPPPIMPGQQPAYRLAIIQYANKLSSNGIYFNYLMPDLSSQQISDFRYLSESSTWYLWEWSNLQVVVAAL